MPKVIDAVVLPLDKLSLEEIEALYEMSTVIKTIEKWEDIMLHVLDRCLGRIKRDPATLRSEVKRWSTEYLVDQYQWATDDQEFWSADMTQIVKDELKARVG